MNSKCNKIDTHEIKRDLKCHIEHSLRMLDDWVFGEINCLTFLAQVRNKASDEGIRGGRVVELHIMDPNSTIEPVAVFKHKKWLVEPKSERRALMEILVSYLEFNPVAKDPRF